MVGNKWFKCDLHLHSTASECFRDKSVTSEQWVAECKEKGLDCVALTDHNTGANIDEYKEVAEKNNLVLFPGVELTCSESKVHLLVIFDRNSGTTEVEDFILAMEISRNQFASSEANSPKTVIDVVKYAEEHGYIVIPAHIDEYNGLSSLSHSARKDIFKSPNIPVVQLVQKEFFDILENNINGEEKQNKFNDVMERYDGLGDDTLKNWFKSAREARDNRMNLLTFSDNPHAEGDSQHGLWGIGQRYTFIKMKENPDLSSLRDALLLGKERTFADFFEFQKNAEPTIINTLVFSGTTLSNEEITVDFSRNLTTIIGGRGTGKSCITRLLFFVLGKEEILGGYPEIESEYRNFAKKSNGESGIFTDNTKVSLEVLYKGTKFKIVRTINSHQVFFVDEADNEVEVGIERLNMVSSKIDLYMQKQIYEISKNQKSILNLVDTFNSVEIEEINDELEGYKSEILKINLDNDELKKSVSQKRVIELKIEDLRRKESKLTNKSIKQIFESNKEELLSKKIISDDLESFRSIPMKLQEVVKLVSIPENKLEISDEIDLLRDSLISKVRRDIETISLGIENISKSVEDYKDQLNNSKWIEDFKKTLEAYSQLKTQLDPEDFATMDNLDVLYNELEEKENLLKEIIERENELDNNQLRIKQYREQIDTCLGKLTRARRDFCNKIFSDIDGIKAQIQPNRDFLDYIKKLRVILGKEDTFEAEFDNLLQKMSRTNFSYREIYKDIEKVNSGVESPSEIFTDKKLINFLKKLSKTQLSDIQVLTPNDLITITIELNGRMVNLSNASAGQKTSAILSMILAYGNSPLVLDQPEDDLDSQLINDLIVKSILKRKENRQIIVVTHNANIPVNGDSEWLICMGDSRNVTADLCGSVDEPKVKNRICRVMEGGDDAFKHRATRYGFKQIN